jgi:hypothetical protein
MCKATGPNYIWRRCFKDILVSFLKMLISSVNRTLVLYSTNMISFTCSLSGIYGVWQSSWKDQWTVIRALHLKYYYFYINVYCFVLSFFLFCSLILFAVSLIYYNTNEIYFSIFSLGTGDYIICFVIYLFNRDGYIVIGKINAENQFCLSTSAIGIGNERDKRQSHFVWSSW